MNGKINAVFLSLKPVCDSIATNPTKEKLIELREILKKSPIPIIQRLHEYILFPLHLHLENNKSISNIIKFELLETLRCIIDKIKLSKTKIFNEICIAITKQVFDKQTASLIPVADEELKLSSVLCLHALFFNITSDILTELYSNSYKVYFSQCIYMCIQIAKQEKMRNLRLSAMNCLMTISYVHDEADFTDSVLRNQIADCLMFFLPGIIIALQEVALGDEKQGHKITSCAIKALKRIIILYMEDDKLEDEKEITFVFPKLHIEEKKVEKNEKGTMEGFIKKLQTETRTPEWYNKTAEKLNKVIKNIKPLQSHYHEIVRYELSDFCKEILMNCYRNLENSLSICIEILISLMEDDNPKVSENSKEGINIINQNYMNFTFIEILADNFHNVIDTLPRIINGTDDHKKLTALNLLVGYLRLLGSEKLVLILQSIDKLNRFLQCLIFISTFEKSNVTLFEEYALRDFESISKTAVTWKQFKYIEEKNLFNKFQITLHLLSNSEAINMIVDSLCDIYSNEYEHRNEIVFLLNEIISVKVEDSQNSIQIIENILKIYIDEENWYLSTDTTEYSLSEIHSNIIQMCLLVEGIGNISSALGINFKSYLLKILYIVLERAGSGQPLLSAAGLLTLLKISQNCGYKSVTELIVQNTDYFSFHVVNRLKKLDTNTAVLDVLNVVMKYSTIEVLPPIMHVVNEVLTNSCKKYQEENITKFLKVFYSYVKCLKRWTLGETTTEDNKIIELLKEYKQNMEGLYLLYQPNIDFSDEIMNKSAKELYEEDMAKSKDELENEYTTEDEHKKIELPEDIKLTVAVLKRSLNFLPSKNRERKLLTLNILAEGLEIIKEWENELLPLVHLIWAPLVDRFKEFDDPLIINRSYELLLILAKVSKEFIRLRTSKEVLPNICITIKQLTSKSYLKDRGSAYRYNQEYKLQLIILNNIAQLVSNLEMSIDDVNLVMKSTLPYLSCKQPIPLQESVLNCYKKLALYDIDTVWFNLLDVWGVQSNRTENEFSKNTEIILKQLDSLR